MALETQSLLAPALDPGATPRTAGRYQLLHELASGGMATVYLGRARGAAGFERLVAIKCCHPHLRREEEFATMFADEARIAAKIHHPNVVATLDVSEDDALYIVMEFVDGYSLWDLLKAARTRGEALATGVAMRIVVDALMGLHAAHELRDNDDQPMNIVHRDVSPHNVLVGVDGTSKIMDFGIAKAESRLSVTRDGRIKGKLQYMAPEQHGLRVADRTHPLTRRADVYAAGVVLWEALTGQRLFQGEDDTQTIKLVVKGVVRAPSIASPGLPPALDAVVMRALERDPEKRFATALEFAEAIEATGVPMASSLAVSASVRRLLSEPVTRRAALLGRLQRVANAQPSDMTAAFERVVQAPPSYEAHTPSTAAAFRPSIVPEPGARVTRRRGFRAGLTAALVALLAGGTALALRASLHTSPTVTAPAPAHTATLASAASVPFAPPAPVAPVAPTVTAPAAHASDPPAAPAPRHHRHDPAAPARPGGTRTFRPQFL